MRVVGVRRGILHMFCVSESGAKQPSVTLTRQKNNDMKIVAGRYQKREELLF